jgi:predicted unusual protein kinase regulating ubiquinone biosynthesis (AarF/ABC1/UbiB family)
MDGLILHFLALHRNVTDRSLPDKDSETCLQTIKQLLDHYGIQSTSSRMAFLRCAYFRMLADHKAQAGEFDQAIWHLHNVSRYSSDEIGEMEIFHGRSDKLKLAELYCRTGQLERFHDALTDLRAAAPDTGAPLSGKLLELRRLCLLRDGKGFQELHDELSTRKGLAPSLRAELAWLDFLYRMLESRNLDAASVHFVRKGRFSRPELQLVFYFWHRCFRPAPSRFVGIASIRKRMERAGIALTPSQKRLFEAGSFIERYSLTDPGQGRADSLLEEFPRVFDATSRLPTLELELLVLGALHRLFSHRRRADLVDSVRRKYSALCLVHSARQTDDILALFTPARATVADRPALHLHRWLARTAKTTQVAWQLKHALQLREAATLEKPGELAAFLDREKTAALLQVLVDNLKFSKGAVLKLGQTFSYAGLPSLEALQSIYSVESSPASLLSFEQVRAVIESELGGGLGSLFTEFSARPIASGSIGQVHRGRLKSGESVAIKVQYPQIRQMIRHDIGLLRMLFPIVYAIAPRLKYLDIIDLIGAQMLQEADFALEARHTAAFRKMFETSQEFAIPRAFPELCTEKVLVTEYMLGIDFWSFIRVATQEERNEAARQITKFVCHSVMSGRFNSDPNPGNFLFGPGRLELLDFGNICEFGPNEVSYYKNLLEGALYWDKNRVKIAMDAIGLPHVQEDFDYEYLVESYLGGYMGNLAWDEARPIKAEEVHRFLRTAFSRKNPSVRNLTLAPAVAISFRLFGGWGFLMAYLKANLNWHRLFKETLAEIAKMAAQ